MNSDPRTAPVRVVQTVSWRLATPPSAAGAVAIFDIHGDLSQFFSMCVIAPVQPGAIALRDLFGIDRALVARFSDDALQLMPHGGTAVVRAIIRALTDHGIVGAQSTDARQLFPEAADDLEARMLLALSHAASPRAIDLLLEQPNAWITRRPHAALDTIADTPRDRTLRHLIHPPLVVAIGPPNIGKSTLINRLAQRAVSIVADVPGTTRDHVGVYLEVDGLVIRYMDTPGIRATADVIEQEAIRIALSAAANADLILHMGDQANLPPELPVSIRAIPRLIVQTRGDLGRAAFSSDVVVGSLHTTTPMRLGALARGIRAALVCDEAISDTAPWRFWD